MISTFARFLLSTVLLANWNASLAALKSGAFVLGGRYQMGPGESLQEDISFYFAQVTIEQGASIDGHILLFSSTLDLAGQVTEDIHAFESDLILRDSAYVEGEVSEKDYFHWTFLLPALAHIP